MSYVFKERNPPPEWSEFKTRARHSCLVPFYCATWLADCAAYFLGKWPLVELLEYLGSFSILFAAIFYFAGASDRLKQKHYQAWQVINTAQGKGGNGGRIDALQELNDDRVSLIGVDVSNAYLEGVRLENAQARRANFSSADLRGASFKHAGLDDADLHWANLRGADLRECNLARALLDDADLVGGQSGRGGSLASLAAAGRPARGGLGSCQELAVDQSDSTGQHIRNSKCAGGIWDMGQADGRDRDQIGLKNRGGH